MKKAVQRAPRARSYQLIAVAVAGVSFAFGPVRALGQVENSWVGGGPTGVWNAGSNWQYGTLAPTDTAVIADSTPTDMYLNGNIVVGSIDFRLPSNGPLNHVYANTDAAGGFSLTLVGDASATLIKVTSRGLNGVIELGSGIATHGLLTVNLVNDGIIDVGDGTLSIFGKIQDYDTPAGIVKTGTGTLYLGREQGTGNTFSNTFSGGFALAEGTLRLGGYSSNSSNYSVLGSGPLILAGGTLQSDGTADWIANETFITNDVAISGPLRVTGPVSLDSGVRTLTVNNSGLTATAMTLSGVISSGSIVKTGTGTLVLGNTSALNPNTHSGVTVNAGVLQANALGALGAGGANVLVNAGGVLAAGYAMDDNFLGRVDPTSQGVVALGSTTSNALHLDGFDDLRLGAIGTFTASGTITPNSDGVYRFGGANGTLTVASSLSGNANVDFSRGATGNSSTLILSGSNSYTGTTNINGGTLLFQSASSMGSGSVTVQSGSVVAAVAGSTLAPNDLLSHLGTSSGGVLALTGASSLNLDMSQHASLRLGSIGTNTYSGVITPHNNTFKFGGGGGTLVVASDLWNSTGVNGIEVSSNGTFFGTVLLTGDVTCSGPVSVASGMTLQYGNNTVIQAVSANSVVNNGAIIINNTDTAALAPTLSGAMSGTGTFTKSGTGALALAGDNISFTGPTTLSAGTLTLGSPNALARSALTYSGGTLNFDGQTDVTIGGLIGSQPLALTSSGGTLNLTLSGQSGRTYTYSGAISGSGSVTVAGAGTARLSGSSSTYRGPVNVTGGTLQLAAVNTLQMATVNITGGDLSFDGQANITLGGLNGSVDVLLASTSVAAFTLTVGANNSDTLYSASLGGTGSLTKVGTGTLTLTGGNTFGGSLTVSAGTLQLGDGGSSGSVAVNILNNANLVLNRGDNSIFANRVTGSGTVTKNGTGTTTLSNTSNSYSGVTRVVAGTLKVGATGALPSGRDVTLVGGLLDLNGMTQATGVLTGASNTVISLGTTTAGALSVPSGTFAGALIGNGSLTKTGSGTLALTGGSNAYTGATNIGGGVLNFTSLGAGPINFTSSGTLQWASDITTDVSVNGISVASGVTGIFDIGGNDVAFSAPILGSGGFHKIGTGTLTVAGQSTYLGTTLVGAGTLRLGAANALPTGGTVNIANGGTLDLATYTQSIGSLIGGGTTGLLKLNSGALNITGVGSAFSGTVDGSVNASFQYSGMGTLVLSGPVNFSGQMTVASGSTLQLGSGGSLTGTLGAYISNDGALWFNRAGGTLTLSQPVSGSGSFRKLGGSTLVLAAANTYTGTTSLEGGTLQLSSNGSLPVGTDVTMTAATLDLNNVSQTIGKLDGTTASVLRLGLGSITVGQGNTATSNSSYAGTITGSVSMTATALTKVGPGTLTLTGSNSFTGLIQVAGGTLSFTTAEARSTGGGNPSPTGRIPTSVVPDFITLNGGTLQSTRTGAGVTFLNSNKGIYLGAAGGAIGVTDATAVNSNIYAGVISGPGSLTKTGSGVFAVLGTNTYSGSTTVAQGTLRLRTESGATGRIPAGTSLTINSGATFDLDGLSQTVGSLSGAGTLKLNGANGNGTLTVGALGSSTAFGGTIVGSSSAPSSTGLVKVGTGTLTITSDTQYTGPTTITAGTLQIGDGTAAAPGLIAGNVANNGVLVFDRPDSFTYPGIISGTGQLTKTGAGTLVLSNDSTLTGPIRVEGGILSMSSGSRLGSGTATITLNGGTLRNTNPVSDLSFVSSNHGIAIGLAGGTMDYSASGASVYAGTVGSSTGGAAVLTKAGNGELSAKATNWGITRLNVRAGLFRIGDTGNDSTLGAVPMTTVADYITLSASDTSSGHGTTQANGGVAFGVTTPLSGTLDIAANRGVLLGATGATFVSNGDFVLNGPISGGGVNGGLTLNGNGWTGSPSTKLVLKGSNTYAGPTVVNYGILRVDGGAAIPNSSAVTLTGSGTNLAILRLSASEEIGSLAGTTLGKVQLGDPAAVPPGTANLVTGGNGQSTSFGGQIEGSGSLTKAGSGTLLLTGANSYTGGTTVSAGRIKGTVASIQGDIVNNAIVELADTDGTYSGVLSGTGTLIKGGTGTVVLTGTNTYGGSTQVTGGTIAVASSANLGDGSSTNGLVLDGGTMRVDSAFSASRALTIGASGATVNTNGNAVTWQGAFGGVGSLTKAGTGTLLTDPFTLGGTLTVSGGILATDAVIGGTSSAASNVSVSSGAQLDIRVGKLVLNSSTATTVTGLLSSGRSGGSWTGSGIISSAAADVYQGSSSTENTSIAWASAETLLGLNATSTATWNGQTVGATSLLLKYTYAGDANLDGRINGDDFALIDRGYLFDSDIWLFGDFDYDGDVDSADYTLINQGYAYYSGAGGGQVFSMANLDSSELLESELVLNGTPLVMPPTDGLTEEFIAGRVAIFGSEYVDALNALLNSSAIPGGGEEGSELGAFAVMPFYGATIPEPSVGFAAAWISSAALGIRRRSRSRPREMKTVA